ncbi:dynamin family protein [Cellulomonas denverensis]|uniref:dynamin family protein n=1 Tax=Cellulomonas denverensis TaxID=264297 RepID=UPI0035ECEFBE
MNTQAAGANGDILDRPRTAAALAEAMADLLRDVRATVLPLDIPGVAAARDSRTRLIDQLADHLVPRLQTLSAPAVVVVAGSTGAGKSTIVNALVGEEVSPAGVLRPTTRRPVLVHHPLDAELLTGHPVLDAVQVEVSDQVPRGIALLDAPDLDSVEEANRRAAGRLLEAADLWLFVTTAARYGDALPWRVLDGAMARGASVAMVLNRVPADSLPTVRADLMQRLREHGMQGSPLFVVADAGPLDGPLDPVAVAPVHRWLAMLAGPDRARSVIARTLRGSLAALRPWVDELAEAVQAQVEAAGELRAGLGSALDPATREARETVARGTVGHGGAQARWAELTSPGAALDGGAARVGQAGPIGGPGPGTVDGGGAAGRRADPLRPGRVHRDRPGRRAGAARLAARRAGRRALAGRGLGRRAAGRPAVGAGRAGSPRLGEQPGGADRPDRRAGCRPSPAPGAGPPVAPGRRRTAGAGRPGTARRPAGRRRRGRGRPDLGGLARRCGGRPGGDRTA